VPRHLTPAGTDADGQLPPVPDTTRMTDRALLLHILQHVEDMHEEQRAWSALLAEFEPALKKIRERASRSRLFGGS